MQHASDPSPQSDGFTRFRFERQPERADSLNRYLRYHFTHRLGNGLTLFNKEYLAISDLWLNDAHDRATGRGIQQTHADHLAAVKLHYSGYVHTHQHFSHAHDYGWPFPFWSQGEYAPGSPGGVAAGWHFQHQVEGWTGLLLNAQNAGAWFGDAALNGWQLRNLHSDGITEGRWRLRSDGPMPALTTPEGVTVRADNAPFIQIRWSWSGPPSGKRPFVEWQREEDTSWCPDRRIEFDRASLLPDELEGIPGIIGDSERNEDGLYHTIIDMQQHPQWSGVIKRIRFYLAPGAPPQEFEIDSIFTCYDTRHTSNNPIFIMACAEQFAWTGDVEWLRRQLDRMRLALRFLMHDLGGLEHNHIRVPWCGHDGRTGIGYNKQGERVADPGVGIGENYWDLLPFGWDSMYATSQYYRALIAMADIEEACLTHPDWSPAPRITPFIPEELRRHARAVRQEANMLFWNPITERFVASIDCDGIPHDYGFTFLNLEAIWYGIAGPQQSRSIMDWITGRRIIPDDTSTGDDIYHWRFGPRATTRRNTDWYQFVWSGPESIPWGGQVQDGGAVLGFSFYDLWARLKLEGPDDAWNRLCGLLDWDDEAVAAGGYRAYYADGAQGATLQGGGTAGGLGIDHEFYESSLIPAIIVRGFLGITATPIALHVQPALPEACSHMEAQNMLYRGIRLHIAADRAKDITITLVDTPAMPIALLPPAGYRCASATASDDGFCRLSTAGVYVFTP